MGAGARITSQTKSARRRVGAGADRACRRRSIAWNGAANAPGAPTASRRDDARQEAWNGGPLLDPRNRQNAVRWSQRPGAQEQASRRWPPRARRTGSMARNPIKARANRRLLGCF